MRKIPRMAQTVQEGYALRMTCALPAALLGEVCQSGTKHASVVNPGPEAWPRH